MSELWNRIITCALRWRVALVGSYSTGRGSPFMGKTFQVQGVHRWTALTRGRICEECRVVALLSFCKIFWNNLVLMCNICKSVVIKLL